MAGLYPLVAAISRESSQEDLAGKTIALIYGPFGSLGLIVAPLVVYLMTEFVVSPVRVQVDIDSCSAKLVVVIFSTSAIIASI